MGLHGGAAHARDRSALRLQVWVSCKAAEQWATGLEVRRTRSNPNPRLHRVLVVAAASPYFGPFVNLHVVRTSRRATVKRALLLPERVAALREQLGEEVAEPEVAAAWQKLAELPAGGQHEAWLELGRLPAQSIMLAVPRGRGRR
jgi:hypothetical protein